MIAGVPFHFSDSRGFPTSTSCSEPRSQSTLVFEVKGNPCRLSRWRNFGFKRNGFGSDLRPATAHSSDAASVFIVKVREQMAGEKHSKGSRQLDLATLQNSSLEVGVSRFPRRSTPWNSLPDRVGNHSVSKLQALPGTQTAHRTVDFSLEIVRARIRIGAHATESLRCSA